MVVQIDAKTLKCRDREVKPNIMPVVLGEDRWDSDVPRYKRKLTPLGARQEFAIQGFEPTTTAWAASDLKYIQDKMISADTMTLAITTEFFSFSGTVYCKQLIITMHRRIRRFRAIFAEKNR